MFEARDGRKLFFLVQSSALLGRQRQRALVSQGVNMLSYVTVSLPQPLLCIDVRELLLESQVVAKTAEVKRTVVRALTT
eukprot:COSAG02_NODE_1666_length_11424_cov_5.733245_7_plen_79_part_00